MASSLLCSDSNSTLLCRRQLVRQHGSFALHPGGRPRCELGRRELGFEISDARGGCAFVLRRCPDSSGCGAKSVKLYSPMLPAHWSWRSAAG